jgi:hypothetical protein
MSICEQPDASQVGRRNQIDRIPNDNIKGLVDACIRKKPSTRPTMQDGIEFWQRVKE